MEEILFAVNGTLMRGFGLNKNLIAAKADFVHEAKTSDLYRLWSIKDQYPAMQRDLGGGHNIDVEIWKITPAALMDILESEPPGLCLGRIELVDKQWVFGVLAEEYICQGMQEITKWGGWRNYLSKKKR
jgi:gamma-glutamylcyclotransferase (GGCT)/AIG2-like uncharacterized protein YtfP